MPKTLVIESSELRVLHDVMCAAFSYRDTPTSECQDSMFAVIDYADRFYREQTGGESHPIYPYLTAPKRTPRKALHGIENIAAHFGVEKSRVLKWVKMGAPIFIDPVDGHNIADPREVLDWLSKWRPIQKNNKT